MKLIAALQATLLFHNGHDWDDEQRAAWLMLTGTQEATTKNLADFVRSALAEVAVSDQPNTLTRNLVTLQTGPTPRSAQVSLADGTVLRNVVRATLTVDGNGGLNTMELVLHGPEVLAMALVPSVTTDMDNMLAEVETGLGDLAQLVKAGEPLQRIVTVLRGYMRAATNLAMQNTNAEAAEPLPLTVQYRNHRGETSTRRIIPKLVRYEATEWHPRPQWLLEAYDIEKQADRTFALADIKNATDEWTCYQDFDAHGTAYTSFVSKSGLWGYARDNPLETLVVGFATEAEAIAKAHDAEAERQREAAADSCHE